VADRSLRIERREIVDASDLEHVNMHFAKTHLSKLVGRVEAGEEIVIDRAGKPVAKLVPVEPKKTGRRKLGIWKGKVEEMQKVDKEIEEMFEESEIFPDENAEDDV
jgi:prevent-host-death family protein